MFFLAIKIYIILYKECIESNYCIIKFLLIFRLIVCVGPCNEQKRKIKVQSCCIKIEKGGNISA
ncbi:hypothetical protein EBR77_01890, partial [bacterium]|nr:hypothetical protein [bacterium]